MSAPCVLTAKITSSIDPCGHLSKALSRAFDDQDHVEKELEALKEVHGHTGPVTIDAKGYIAIIL